MVAVIIVLLLIVLVVLGYDYLPDLLNWIGRIKIGQVTENNEWLDSVKTVVIKWGAKGTPSVPKNENQKLKLINEIKNRGTTSPICYWQDAAILKALTEKTGAAAQDSADSLLERYIDIETRNWIVKPKRADVAILAYEMLSNDFISNESIEPAMDFVAQMLKTSYKEWGYIPYNSRIPEICFVDTIGMVCPFLIKYAAVYNKTEFVSMAIGQIAQYFKLGFDEETKLPFHCFNAEEKTHLGICGWGRGCGWWSVGLVDSLKEIMKLDDFNKEKKFLLKLSMYFLDDFEKYIDKNGAVDRMLLNSSLPDSSASAMLAYCYAYMFSLVKKEAYYDNADRIIQYLKTATRKNGVIDYSQGDTMGIGYYSSSFSVVPAAQGFAATAAMILYK